jgi:hypothetical protein
MLNTKDSNASYSEKPSVFLTASSFSEFLESYLISDFWKNSEGLSIYEITLYGCSELQEAGDYMAGSPSTAGETKCVGRVSNGRSDPLAAMPSRTNDQ